MIHWIQPEDVDKARERWRPFFERISEAPLLTLKDELYHSPLWMAMNTGTLLANFGYDMALPLGELSERVLQDRNLSGMMSVISPLYSAVGLSPHSIRVRAGLPAYAQPSALEHTARYTIGMMRATEKMLEQPPAFSVPIQDAEGDESFKAMLELTGKLADVNNDIASLPDYIKRLLLPTTAHGTVALWGHEVAHHLLQIADEDILQPLKQLERPGATYHDVMQSVFHQAARATFISQWLHEGMSDAFGTALSLQPYSIVSGRYAGLVYDMLRYADARGEIPQSFRNWRYGDPIDVPVVPTWVVESDSSPVFTRLMDILHQYHNDQAMANDELGLKYGIGSVSRLVQSGLSGQLTEIGWRKQFAGAFGYLVNALKSGPLQTAWNDPKRHEQMAEGMDEVSAFVWRTVSSRAWIVPYWTGKARPELVGKHLEYRPDRITVKETGEEIDVASMLPDLKPIVPSEDTPVLPIRMERGLKAADVYRRMRAAIRRGVRFNENQYETLETNLARWQEMFQNIMQTEELAE